MICVQFGIFEMKPSCAMNKIIEEINLSFIRRAGCEIHLEEYKKLKIM